MGQKTNPNIIRLGTTKEWKSKYIEKKLTESSTLIFRDLEIQKYLSQLFAQNELQIQDCKISYSESSLYIFISFYNSQKSALFGVANQKIKLETRKSLSTSFKKRIHTFQKAVAKRKFYTAKTYNKNRGFYYKRTPLQNKHILNYKTRRLQSVNYLKTYLDGKKYKTLHKQGLHSFTAKIMKGLNLFVGKKQNIFLSLRQVNREFNVLQQVPKKHKKTIEQNFAQLRKFQQNEFFKRGVNILYNFVVNEQNPKFLAEMIAFYLTKLKRPNFFLRFIKVTLKTLTQKHFSKLERIKLKIKGRFNGAPRSRHKIIHIGKSIPVLTLSSKVNYGESTAYTSNGTFGVKVWTYQK